MTDTARTQGPGNSDSRGTALARLAIQVTDLRKALDLSRRELSERIDRLEETVARALDAASPKGPAALKWEGIAPETRRLQLAAVAAWVTGTLIPEYPSARIPECWPDHPEAVWELGNGMCEWKRIYSPDSLPLADALTLWDRVLPGIITRVKKATSNCTTECVMTRRTR